MRPYHAAYHAILLVSEPSISIIFRWLLRNRNSAQISLSSLVLELW